jgi:hypothetical protein
MDFDDDFDIVLNSEHWGGGHLAEDVVVMQEARHSPPGYQQQYGGYTQGYNQQQAQEPTKMEMNGWWDPSYLNEGQGDASNSNHAHGAGTAEVNDMVGTGNGNDSGVFKVERRGSGSNETRTDRYCLSESLF